jgi:hypothetical protein
LVGMMMDRNWREKLAFDGFIDDYKQAIFRQMFRRIGKQ